MVLSNIGTITLALPPSPGSQKNDTSRQVGFLSISNTASRVIIGPLLDILFHRQQVSNTLSQIWFLTFASLLLACGALFMALDIPQTRSALWVLSITSGIAYGTTWTLLCVALFLNFLIHSAHPSISGPYFLARCTPKVIWAETLGSYP